MREHDVRDKMAAGGMPCYEPLVMDGRIHRYKIDGRGKRNGWYYLIERGDNIFGMAGNWKTGDRISIGTYDRTMRQVVRQQAVARVDEAARAAITAQEEWADLKPSGDSEYLKRKQVPSFGLRFGAVGVVVVPMRKDGKIVGLQRIFADGKKLYTKGCAKQGARYVIIGAPDRPEVVVVCEGYATGASIHMATGFTVVVAFDCGNLLPVAKSVRAAHPKVKLMIVADNDKATVCARHKKDGVLEPVSPMRTRANWCKCNPGLTEGLAVAKAVKATVAWPPGTIVGTDANDMHLEVGLTEVAAMLYDVL